MIETKYQLRYLPLFFDDVNHITSYIRSELCNPEAASKLIDDIESAILERLPVCESFEPYHSKKERKYPYYRIYIKNYVIYYVIIEDIGKKNNGSTQTFI